MLTSQFLYKYPEALVATEPRANSRMMRLFAEDLSPSEISKIELFTYFKTGDVIAINDTRVLRRRVTALNGVEILFLKQTTTETWQVLCPARELNDHEAFQLPGGVSAKLIRRGLPQELSLSGPLDEAYFQRFGELALPPYIQKARGERHNREQEESWYQTAWAKNPGSQAAPTASLHFTSADLEFLRARGVFIAPLTLHVGMGTFLPVKTAILDDHKMHSESAFIPAASAHLIREAKAQGQQVWALGTTVVRALESWGHGHLSETAQGDVSGDTDIFIRPGFQFEVVDGLLTNFHQPCSTLLALVAAFAGRERVLSAYEWAMAKNFRLFSYGDLSIWTRK